MLSAGPPSLPSRDPVTGLPGRAGRQVTGQVMGIVNVTPDSFSDGGRYLDHEAAITHGRRLFADGAEVVDVGGESTRPGAQPVSEAEELRRVLPVVEALAHYGRVSVDTTKVSVAEAALAAGATLVNDVSARLWPVVAAAGPGAGWIAVHRQGDPATMQRNPQYRAVVAEVAAALERAAAEAGDGGVAEVYIDPGIGFGKTTAHNVTLLAALDRLVATGWPVCLGVSRKASMGVLSAHGSEDPPVLDREEASLAVATWAFALGVRLVRVHEVRPTVDALRIAQEPVSA